MADEPEVQKDSGEAQPSTVTVAATSFTRDQVDKAVSDALSRAGRDAKSLEQIRIEMESRRSALDTERSSWQRERDEAEEARVRDDPPALKALRESREQRALREGLARQKADQDAREAKLAELAMRFEAQERRREADVIASEFNVDANNLQEFTDGKPESMRKLAQLLPKKQTLPGTPSTPDSGRTTGSATFTSDNIDALWLQGKVSDEDYRAFNKRRVR